MSAAPGSRPFAKRSCLAQGLALVLLLRTAGAAAGSDDVVKFLLGSWSVDCARGIPRGPLPVVFFRTPGSARLWLLSFRMGDGSMSPDLTEVVIEDSLPNGRAAVRFIHSDGSPLETVLDLKDEDDYSVLRSAKPDGTELTKDGVVLRTGKPSVIYHRCSPR